MQPTLRKYIFCNIGWMKFYKGETPDDLAEGGGSSNIKFEVCNFLPVDGKLFGYVQPPGPGDPLMRRILIENIEGSDDNAESEYEKDVFVIWTATNPGVGCVIVGWYRNATVYRKFQKFQTVPELHKANSVLGYRIVAEDKESKLFPTGDRKTPVPRIRRGAGENSGRMGNSNVWFGKSPQGFALAQQVWELANQKHENLKGHWSSNVDPEHNEMVEKAAVNAVIKHYEEVGCRVRSVEDENLGWDLEEDSSKEDKLLIEVKGLSGSKPIGSLSSNEYKKFKAKMLNYRLVIVTNALDNPKIWICYFCEETQRWQVEGDGKRKVKTKEIIGARITVE